MKLGAVFTDAEVARAYRYRPEYPDETFTILEELVVGPQIVLDAGSGTGKLARGMLRFAERVDAVDPSAAMIAEGRRLPGGDDPRLRWVLGTAEEAPLAPPYGLITTGQSVHWMDPDTVMPRFAAALAPGAHLAILEPDDGDYSLRDEMRQIIDRYSELEHHAEFAETVAGLQASGHFVKAGERRTAPVPLVRTVDEHLEFLHSTSTLARVRLGNRTAAFDADVRALFATRGVSSIERQVQGVVVWGRPR